MAVTSNDVANQAIQLVGNNVPAVVGQAPAFATTGPGGTSGPALNRLYAPTVAAVARSHEWDFARRTVALAASGNIAPVPWAFEWVYPTNGIQVWQVMPTVLADPNDPLPVNWDEGNVVVGAVTKRVLYTNFSPAQAVFNNNPNEDVWDATFRQAVVELLARALAMALAGKPDLAETLLQSYGTFQTIGENQQG